LHNNQSPNHSTSKYLKFAERTGHQFIYECNRMGIQTKTPGSKLVSQTGPICKVKGTHRTSSHDDQDRLSLYMNPR
jgi:hypothetical protein